MLGALIWLVSFQLVYGRLGAANLCDDTVGFVDAKNRSCSEWLGLACDNAVKYGYTIAEAKSLWSNCGKSCEKPCSERSGFFESNSEISYRSLVNVTVSNSGRTISLDGPAHQRGLAIFDETIRSIALRVAASNQTQSITLLLAISRDDDAKKVTFANDNDIWAKLEIVSHCNDTRDNPVGGTTCAGHVTRQLVIKENNKPNTTAPVDLRAGQRIVLKCESDKLNVLLDSVPVFIFLTTNEPCEEGMIAAFELRGENHTAVTGIVVVQEAKLTIFTKTAIAWSVMLLIAVTIGFLCLRKSKKVVTNDADVKFQEEAEKAHADTLNNRNAVSGGKVPMEMQCGEKTPPTLLPRPVDVNGARDTFGDTKPVVKKPPVSLSRLPDLPDAATASPVRRRTAQDDSGRSHDSDGSLRSPNIAQGAASKVTGAFGTGEFGSAITVDSGGVSGRGKQVRVRSDRSFAARAKSTKTNRDKNNKAIE
eukprot:GEMP01018235.1.p1 GENE.GEMP01018235.1~~GEMP01018235.1.p1  ORF type:complete len:478 (+),score=82.47 GEMP01018235.1:207-1640(+)